MGEVRHRWSLVMIVMPAFAESENSDEGVISGLVRRLVWTGAEGVTNGIDGPNNLVSDHQA